MNKSLEKSDGYLPSRYVFFNLLAWLIGGIVQTLNRGPRERILVFYSKPAGREKRSDRPQDVVPGRLLKNATLSRAKKRRRLKA